MGLTLLKNPRMSERTTLRLGGPALAEAVVCSQADLEQLAKALPELGGRPMALGAGSNLLAGDGEHALVLVRPANAEAPQPIPQADGATLLRAGAGFGLPRLLGYAQRLGLSGLEPLSGIPGRLGGAVAMNAGSYGTEAGKLISRVRLWSPGLGLFWREASDCVFGYRHFDPDLGKIFWLVWEVELVLRPCDPAAIHERMVETYARKKATQPVTAHSAGCVFKNPAGLPAGMGAGKLLDEAGLRGRRLGNMAFSDKHANFLVNLGDGTAAQALELMELGREAVLARFGVNLETEVVVLP